MKLSRIGAAALCAALCLGTMSGCSSKTDGANEGGSQTAESQTTAGQTTAGGTEAGGAAGSDEKFTLKIPQPERQTIIWIWPWPCSRNNTRMWSTS